MSGDECPNCGKDMGGIPSTTNEWNKYCPKCNIRFKSVRADQRGTFTFDAADAGRSILYGKEEAFVAMEGEWLDYEPQEQS